MSDPVGRPEESARCSVAWRETTHVAFGTAPVARFWVGVEQPGPWGRKAFTDSRLDAEVGARLDKEVSARGGKAALVRRPATRADHEAERTLLVATGLDTPRPVLGTRVVAASGIARAIDELISNLDAVAEGALPPGHEPGGAALLVCSNGRRDQCCALEARPLLTELCAEGANDLPVWEASHLNGHRFSPTAVVLPTGQMGAWLDADAARELLAAASEGRLWPGGPRTERGRTHLAPGVQAVDVQLRSQIDERRPGVLTYTADPELGSAGPAGLRDRTATVTARHDDGRTWRFVVGGTHADTLPESCGKAAVPVADWLVREA